METLVVAADSATQARVDALAERPGLQAAAAPPEAGAYLILDAEGLSLHGDGGSGRLRVDFGGGRVGWRLEHGGGRGQAVARAVGVKKGRPLPRVLDATAGLGRDAAVLATLGCEVLAVERHPAVHALLEDGLARAGERFQGRLHLLQGDSRALLEEAARGAGPIADFAPDVVLVDPMHPPRRKSALPKQEMRLFRALLGADEDQLALLAAARALPGARVAVKRPAGEPPLAPGAEHAVEGRTTRFDVYLPRQTGPGVE